MLPAATSIAQGTEGSAKPIGYSDRLICHETVKSTAKVESIPAEKKALHRRYVNFGRWTGACKVGSTTCKVTHIQPHFSGVLAVIHIGD